MQVYIICIYCNGFQHNKHETYTSNYTYVRTYTYYTSELTYVCIIVYFYPHEKRSIQAKYYIKKYNTLPGIHKLRTSVVLDMNARQICRRVLYMYVCYGRQVNPPFTRIHFEHG